MAYLTWLADNVQNAIIQKRIGTPVALRGFFLLSPDHGLLLPTLAEVLTTAAQWFGSPLTRIYALGGVRAGEITALAEFSAGQTALLTAATLRDATAMADLLVVGNHGTLRHQDHPESFEPGRADPKLARALERSLAAGAPVEVER
jgi:hypothetical protein